MVERKYIDKHGWSRLESNRTLLTETTGEPFFGYASAVWMEKVRAPLIRPACGRPLRLADDGFLWIQVLPHGKHWALTVMLDDQRRVLQWYYDITLTNTVSEEGRPCFDDLFLDVIVLPTGEKALLDADELLQALESGVITRRMFDLARAEAAALLDGPETQLPVLEQRAVDYLRYFESGLQVR